MRTKKLAAFRIVTDDSVFNELFKDTKFMTTTMCCFAGEDFIPKTTDNHNHLGSKAWNLANKYKFDFLTVYPGSELFNFLYESEMIKSKSNSVIIFPKKGYESVFKEYNVNTNFTIENKAIEIKSLDGVTITKHIRPSTGLFDTAEERFKDNINE